MNSVQLTTERLILRRMAMPDAPAFHAILSDPDAMRYWSTLPHQEFSQTEAWVAETITAVGAGKADDFAITLDGCVIGKTGLWRGAELGILLGRAHWGRGYAQEAVRAVIERAFAQGAPQIDADVDPRNAASLTLLGRLGFQKTGEAKATFQLGDVWADSVYLRLTPAGYGT